MAELQSILVVDDDAEMLKALTFALETEGYKVAARPDARSAVELILATAKHFDLVITDVSMPGMKGTQLLTTLKTAFPSTPVIIITAFGDWEQYAQAMSEGAFEFLSKPIAKEELLACVRRALAEESQPAPEHATPPRDAC
jgi:DNA-binding NtrC family response regulator